MTVYEVIIMLIDLTIVPLTIIGLIVSFVMYNANYTERSLPNYNRPLPSVTPLNYTVMNIRNTYSNSNSKKEQERRLYCNKVTSIKKIYYKRKKLKRSKRLKRKNR